MTLLEINLARYLSAVVIFMQNEYFNTLSIFMSSSIFNKHLSINSLSTASLLDLPLALPSSESEATGEIKLWIRKAFLTHRFLDHEQCQPHSTSAN